MSTADAKAQAAQAHEAALARIPAALRRAIERGSPDEIYREAKKHYPPTALGMVTTPPYSGGPLMGFFVPGTAAILPAMCCPYFTASGLKTECFHVAQLPILTIVPSNKHVGALLERLERALLDETKKNAWLASEAPAQPPDGHTFCSVSVGPEYQVGDRFLLKLATGHALKLEVQEGWPGAEVRLAVPDGLVVRAIARATEHLRLQAPAREAAGADAADTEGGVWV